MTNATTERKAVHTPPPEVLLRCVQREVDAGHGISEETMHAIDMHLALKEEEVVECAPDCPGCPRCDFSGAHDAEHAEMLDFVKMAARALADPTNRCWATIKPWTKKERDESLLNAARAILAKVSP